ncbi:MAG: lytic transglycosylase domain-containing protein [Gemmatimonadaceae bacterium]
MPTRTVVARVIAYALAVAMGISTLVAGLEHSSFLVQATGSGKVVAAVAAGAMQALVSAGSTVEPVVGTAFLDTGMDHPTIEKWVGRLTTTLKYDFANSMTRMDKYAGMITAKLDAKQMPRELIYLAMIESNFNPNARSKVGAVGMWQFMSATARQFGLTVKGRTDERKDPVDATDAALTYLSQLHDRFGSWYLAAAAYNSGAGTVSKALKKVTGKSQGTDEDFFRILSSLPRETQDYVPKLIASARVGNELAKSGANAD